MRERAIEDHNYKSAPPFGYSRRVRGNSGSKIEISQKQNETLDKIGQTIFKHWFVDFEFPNEKGKPYKSSGGKMIDSELGPIPEGWKVEPLTHIAEYLNGLALQKYPPISDERLPVIKIRELKQGITNNTDYANAKIPNEYIIHNGDILFSWSGSLEIVIWCYGKGALNQHLFKVTSNKYPKWFYFYWTFHYLNKFKRIAESKATTMGHIKRCHLAESKVLIPSINKMQIFSKIFTQIIGKKINNKIQIQTLQRTRDLLLPQLMTGKIRVPLKIVK
jgi:type I restriction enzyme S subunit